MTYVDKWRYKGTEYDIQDSNLKEDFDAISNMALMPIHFKWEHGGIDNETGETNNNGSTTRSRDITYYDVDDLVSVTNGSSSMLWIIFYTYSNNAYTFSSAASVAAGNSYAFTSGEYVRFDIRGGLSEAVLVSGYKNKTTIVTAIETTNQELNNVKSEAEITKNIVDDVLITIDKSINLLNPNALTANSIFKDDGTLNTSSQWYSAYSVSDFIDVEDHVGEYIYNTYGNATNADNRSWMNLYGYCFYGADKSTVVSINKTFTGNNFQVPSEAKYVRVCSQTALITVKGMTYFGTGKVDYVEFYENIVPADRLRVEDLKREVEELKSPRTVLFPNTIYGVVGHPFSIYYYNIIKCD
mgnify:CR=1 FL=1